MRNDGASAAIMKAVGENFEEQIDFTAELVKFPSSRGREQTAQDFMTREMADRGLTVDRWKIKDLDAL